MLHIDIWQSSQSGISLHGMRISKQADVADVVWQPENLVEVMKLYSGTHRIIGSLWVMVG